MLNWVDWKRREYLQPIKSSRGGRSVEHKGFYLNQMQRRIRREFIRNAKTQSEYNAMKKRSDDLGEKSSPTRGGVQFNSSWHFFWKSTKHYWNLAVLFRAINEAPVWPWLSFNISLQGQAVIPSRRFREFICRDKFHGPPMYCIVGWK